MPIYLVITPAGERLVDAPTKSSAINHVIRPGVTAQALSVDDFYKKIKGGAVVETVSEEVKEVND